MQKKIGIRTFVVAGLMLLLLHLSCRDWHFKNLSELVRNVFFLLCSWDKFVVVEGCSHQRLGGGLQQPPAIGWSFNKREAWTAKK